MHDTLFLTKAYFYDREYLYIRRVSRGHKGKLPPSHLEIEKQKKGHQRKF